MASKNVAPPTLIPTGLLDACVHCGFCLPACPTYTLWGQEMDSPRGRIYLMKLATDGESALTPNLVQHIDTCLGCMACMTACPSGVQYDKLLAGTRAQIERDFPRPATDRWFRRLLFELFPHRGRLGVARVLLALYQGTGLQTAVRRAGLLRGLPLRLRGLEAVAPRLQPVATIAPVTPALGPTRQRVGLLLGCVQQAFLSEINAATVRVLTAEGCEVVAPPSQPCCGALLEHAGAADGAKALARRLIDSFDAVDVIITNAAGCGSHVKEYAYLLRDDPTYAERAAHFAERCQDITEFLATLPSRAGRHAMPVRVAYQDACHLRHAQGIVSEPRALLAAIPGLDLVELPEPGLCCGSAGIYNLVQPTTAQELGDRKAAHIVDAQPDIVATGNPGCLLQLQASLARSGHEIPVVHTVQLLDAAINGTMLGSTPPRTR